MNLTLSHAHDASCSTSRSIMVKSGHIRLVITMSAKQHMTHSAAGTSSAMHATLPADTCCGVCSDAALS